MAIYPNNNYPTAEAGYLSGLKVVVNGQFYESTAQIGNARKKNGNVLVIKHGRKRVILDGGGVYAARTTHPEA
ncbi:hypothetical protein IV102_22170 [bacterium]|nr:hypothetical protein [bacterium]